MTRVLHVLPTRSPAYGGPVRVAEAMARQLPEHGFEVELFPEAERPHGVAFWPGLGQLRALRRAVRRAALIHVHGLWTFPTSVAAALADAAQKPYVVTPHGMLDRWSRNRSRGRKQAWAWLFERRNLRAAGAIHFFNREEQSEALEFGALAPSFILPNGVDVAALARLPGRAQLSARLGGDDGCFRLLFLGRIHPKKGFDVLIPALAAVRTPQPVRLLIAGPDEGGYRAEVERLITVARLNDRVRFLGEVHGETKRELLGGADAFVLPSHQEGDSIAVKEALASGLPVLISDKCHFPEVESEGAGVVVPDTVDAVVRGLEMLINEEHGAHAERRERARSLGSRFDWSELTRALAGHYRALLR